MRSGNGKIGIWIFLLSELLGFAALWLADGMLRAGASVWQHPGEPALNASAALTLTLVLAASNVAAVLSVAAAERQKRALLCLGLAAAWLAGAGFLASQWSEAQGLWGAGLRFGGSAYANTFFAIVGFHALHVLAGLIWLGIVFGRALVGKGGAPEVELVALFWNLVGAAWLVDLSVLYLAPWSPGAIGAIALSFVGLGWMLRRLRGERAFVWQSALAACGLALVYAATLFPDAGWRHR